MHCATGSFNMHLCCKSIKNWLLSEGTFMFVMLKRLLFSNFYILNFKSKKFGAIKNQDRQEHMSATATCRAISNSSISRGVNFNAMASFAASKTEKIGTKPGLPMWIAPNFALSPIPQDLKYIGKIISVHPKNWSNNLLLIQRIFKKRDQYMQRVICMIFWVSACFFTKKASPNQQWAEKAAVASPLF